MEETRTQIRRLVLDVLETLIFAGLLYLAVTAFSARVRVDGSSMEPTLIDGEFVIVNRLAYQFSEPDQGDVIVFHYPRDPQETYIKRVIGTDNDRIEVRNGDVFVNDSRLDEPYILSSPHYSDSWTVPEGQLFVLGDNRNNSSDSHKWGFVPKDYVIGKAIFVYWPPNRWGTISRSVRAAP